jgi:hypothetical protein
MKTGWALEKITATYNHQLRPALSISPSTNNVYPSVSPISGRVIPVTEVHKWQQQPKLQQHQQQVLSNAG